MFQIKKTDPLSKGIRLFMANDSPLGFVGWFIVVVSLSLTLPKSLPAESVYEHPLLHGGGNPSTQTDFPQKLSEFIAANGGGNTGEGLLKSYFGPNRRNDYIPDLVVAYGKGRKDPVMALVYKGRTVDRLPNEAYVWAVIFTEERAPILAQVPVKPDPPVATAADSKDVCMKEASQLQVRLEGLAYEKEKDSGINAMEVIKMYTGKEPSITESKPLDGDCAAVDFTKTGPVAETTIKKVMVKFPLTKEAVYRMTFQAAGAQQSSAYHFSNMRLSWFGAGVGAGAVREVAWFKKATVKPYIFGHLYLSKFLNPWNRSLAVVAGIPLENKVDEATVGLRWSPANEWKNPDFARWGLILGYNYHRPIDKFAGTGKQWRFLAGVDYKL